jgi:hypothetical protein
MVQIKRVRLEITTEWARAQQQVPRFTAEGMVEGLAVGYLVNNLVFKIPGGYIRDEKGRRWGFERKIAEIVELQYIDTVAAQPEAKREKFFERYSPKFLRGTYQTFFADIDKKCGEVGGFERIVKVARGLDPAVRNQAVINDLRTDPRKYYSLYVALREYGYFKHELYV